MEQRAHRLDVVRLERRDVPGEQIAPDGVVQLGELVAVEPSARERVAGALQRAGGGRDGHLERVGGLAGGEREHVAHEQHGTLPRRQVLQRGEEREPHGLALRGDGGRIGRVRAVQGAGVGHGLEPRVRSVGTPSGPPRPAGRHRRQQLRRRADRSMSRHTLVAIPCTQVRSDPARDRTAPRPIGPDHRLLHRVIGVGGRSEHPVAVPGQRPRSASISSTPT